MNKDLKKSSSKLNMTIMVVTLIICILMTGSFVVLIYSNNSASGSDSDGNSTGDDDTMNQFIYPDTASYKLNTSVDWGESSYVIPDRNYEKFGWKIYEYNNESEYAELKDMYIYGNTSEWINCGEYLQYFVISGSCYYKFYDDDDKTFRYYPVTISSFLYDDMSHVTDQKMYNMISSCLVEYKVENGYKYLRPKSINSNHNCAIIRGFLGQDFPQEFNVPENFDWCELVVDSLQFSVLVQIYEPNNSYSLLIKVGQYV